MSVKPRNFRSRRASRGFTLIELMVVVIIIGVVATLAMPSLLRQMRERRARNTTESVATLYRNARMRALGRGSSVLVKYDSSGGFTVLESIEGTAVATAHNNANCAPQPGLGCLANNWADTALSRQVDSLALPSDSRVTAYKTDGTTGTAKLDVCFTPMGRSFISYNGLAPTSAMAGVASVSVRRGDGLSRKVVILPNGMARLAL